MKTKNLADLKAFLQGYADAMNIELVDVEFKMSKNPSLTIYIDTEDGVDLDTCEKFHREIDGPLDEYDFTCGSAYTLNVSSPGLDRPLKTARDFDRALGQQVEIKLYAPERGNKFFEGLLVGYDENNIVVEINGTERKFALSTVAKVNIAIIFD